MITKIEGTCQYEGCGEPATEIAEGRRYKGKPLVAHKLGLYCEAHANLVSDEGTPEYVVGCPNCGCMFGVN